MEQYKIEARPLGEYQVIVLGGGVAGVCAAVTAARQGAKVLLCEAMGCLGGTMTQGLVPQMLDAENKGGLVREFYDALNAKGMTCPRQGARVTPEGKKLCGALIDVEGAKVYFDTLCQEAGVEVLLYTRVVHAEVHAGRIRGVVLATECGNFFATGQVFVEATGNGALAALVGLEWEIGKPDTGEVQPASMSVQVVGLPSDYNDTSTGDDKTAYANMLREHGITVSSDQVAVMRLPSLKTWLYSANFSYHVRPEDPFQLTRSTMDGRKECLETVRKQAQIDGYSALWAVDGCEHIGLREGRRVRGKYRLTLEDILSGARFEDAVCTVRANIDIHKLNTGDTVGTARGYRTRPYHIPYRCLLPQGVENLLLAGRVMSGDFYAHASYRMMGDMSATGEAVGWAAVKCLEIGGDPAQVNGVEVSNFMRSRGYEI